MSVQDLGISLLGHRHYKPQIRPRQFLQCFLVSLPDPLSQLNFFFNGYQILFTNFLQILIQRCTFPVGY